jgi:hypothetical protein
MIRNTFSNLSSIKSITSLKLQNVFTFSFAISGISRAAYALHKGSQHMSTTEEKNHSTGPRTEEGKAISSLNAVKHGLTAVTVLLPGEDAAAYQTLYNGMLQDFDPITTTETALLQELIDVQWRLRRASAFETRVLSFDTPDMKALNSMSLIAARLKRQFSATLKEFNEMHPVNVKKRTSLRNEAELIHRADRILRRPSTLADCGFDFTPEDIESELAVSKAVAYAKEVVENYAVGLKPDGETDLDESDYLDEDLVDDEDDEDDEDDDDLDLAA